MNFLCWLKFKCKFPLLCPFPPSLYRTTVVIFPLHLARNWLWTRNWLLRWNRCLNYWRGLWTPKPSNNCFNRGMKRQTGTQNSTEEYRDLLKQRKNTYCFLANALPADNSLPDVICLISLHVCLSKSMQSVCSKWGTALNSVISRKWGK